MNRIIFALLLAPGLFAGINGTIVNKSTGKPQADVVVRTQGG